MCSYPDLGVSGFGSAIQIFDNKDLTENSPLALLKHSDRPNVRYLPQKSSTEHGKKSITQYFNYIATGFAVFESLFTGWRAHMMSAATVWDEPEHPYRRIQGNQSLTAYQVISPHEYDCNDVLQSVAIVIRSRKPDRFEYTCHSLCRPCLSAISSASCRYILPRMPSV